MLQLEEPGMRTVARGALRKMACRHESPVAYAMRLFDPDELRKRGPGQADASAHGNLPLNEWLGQAMQVVATGRIFCVHCGRKTSKSFNQGYCYPCFRKLAQCDRCITSPERCHFDAVTVKERREPLSFLDPAKERFDRDEGPCREPAWGERHCLTSHFVYLANTSGLKVGITRNSQIPTRWIDQGATQALAIARVRERRQSGYLERLFAQHVSDKTHWREMLKGTSKPLDLLEEKSRLVAACQAGIDELTGYFGKGRDACPISILQGVEPVQIDYPVPAAPVVEHSFNFDKEAMAGGILRGIKGQYLLFDQGVFNVRRFSGHEIEIRLEE